MIGATVSSGAACPRACSAQPALRVLDWRDARLAATGRACRVLVAARLDAPGTEWRAFRAPQLANFPKPLPLDHDAGLERAPRGVDGLDAAAVVARIDDVRVVAAYTRDEAEARTAAGPPTELQGEAAAADGVVRAAPSVVPAHGGLRLEPCGWQPAGAYDVLVADLGATLPREPPPGDPAQLPERVSDGLTTQGPAVLLAARDDPRARTAPERALLAAADGRAARVAAGDDAVWRAAA